MSLYTKSKHFWEETTARLQSAGEVFPALFLRLILFWEFWESGYINKYAAYKAGGGALEGTINWFGSLNFPFPFDQLSAETNFMAAMWGEMIFAVLLLLGLFTRFAAISLIVITAVAAAAAHWPESYSSLSELWKGYAISDKGYGNYKLALLFIIMLVPLAFNGGGKLSLDHVLNKFLSGQDNNRRINDLASWGLAFLTVGLPLSFVFTTLGTVLLLAGAGLLIANKLLTPSN